MFHALAVAAILIAAAAQGQQAKGAVGEGRQVPGPVSGAYRSLFRVQPGKPVQPNEVQITGRAIEIPQKGLRPGPCGMPTIAADASGDPEMIVAIPEEVKRASKIRVIEPPPCGEPRVPNR